MKLTILDRIKSGVSLSAKQNYVLNYHTPDDDQCEYCGSPDFPLECNCGGLIHEQIAYDKDEPYIYYLYKCDGCSGEYAYTAERTQ